MPPAIVADVVPEPLHPFRDVRLHKLLGVVDVGGCMKNFPRGGCSPAAKVPVVPHDCTRVPIEPAPKLVPNPTLVLQRCTTEAVGSVYQPIDIAGLEQCEMHECHGVMYAARVGNQYGRFSCWL